MNLLALDTSTDYCSAALLAGDTEQVRDCLAGQRQSELLLPMVRELLTQAGMTLNALDGIAFGAGPGSFTGLRIACGAAQGLAFGAGLPVVAISSLLAMAEGSGADRVIAALDARMGEIYHAAYQKTAAGWREVTAPNLCRPEQAPELEGAGWCGVGNGFTAHRAALVQRYGEQLAHIDDTIFPHARQVARLALHELQQGRSLAPDQAAPIYVRNKVALTILERGVRA